MVTQSGMLMVLTVASIVAVVVMIWALLKLLKTIEMLGNRVDQSLLQVEKTVADLQKTNAIIQEVVSHAEKSAANIEHVTEGVRKFRKTLDAATGVLDYAVLPVLGTVAGVLAGSKAGVLHAVGRKFRKEGRHGG